MSPGRILFAWIPLAVLLLAAGCGGDNPALTPESDEPLFREGQQLEKQGKTQEALNSYLKLIGRRGDQAPESHLDVGLIYLNHIKDPIDAIYYFRKYLEVEPNSRLAPNVRGLIDTAEREFASTLPAQPLEDQSGRLEMADRVTQLQNENNELRAELAALRAGAPPPPLHPAENSVSYYTPPVVPVDGGGDSASSGPAVVPVPAEGPAAASAPSVSQAPAASGRTHTVAKGDTLYNLAQRYYGNRSRWRDILAANREQLKGDSRLRIGMTLKIP